MRHPDHSVHPQFVDRWSPRAFTAEAIDEPTLMTMFEAGRWAPSSSNIQPWRLVYGRRGTPAFQTIVDGLMPGNQVWARNAAALVVMVGATTSVAPGKTEARPAAGPPQGGPAPSGGSERRELGGSKPNGTYAFDCGSAWMSIALQAHAMGWATHGMGGIERDKLKESLHVPADHAVIMAFAIGRRGDKATLPEALREREVPSARRPLAQSIGEGRFPG